MSSNSKKIRNSIKEIISDLMDRVIHKVLIDDPFIPEIHHQKKPLYAALVPDEIFKGSHFERRFVTSFGNIWEKLASTVAKEFHGECIQGYSITGLVPQKRLQRITEILNSLEHRTNKNVTKTKPDWNNELKYILAGKGENVRVTVEADIFIKNLNTKETFAIELKSPLPNSDQTKVSKEKIFKLLAMEPCPVSSAFYALPYNPYGKKELYSWSFPNRWFNMQHDPCVLIGEEFWDTIGGKGIYKIFIDEVNKLGKEYKETIYKDFLGFEPNINLKTGELL